MSLRRNRKGRRLLVSLRHTVSLKRLPQVQPVFLLQIMVAFSQALNGSAAHAEALGRGLMLDGRRRLNGLRRAAPHLSLSLEQILLMARTNKANADDLSTEESAAQALFEVCLGLVLQWLSRRDRQPRLSVSAPALNQFPPVGLSSCTSLPLIRPLRARSCPTLQP